MDGWLVCGGGDAVVDVMEVACCLVRVRVNTNQDNNSVGETPANKASVIEPRVIPIPSRVFVIALSSVVKQLQHRQSVLEVDDVIRVGVEAKELANLKANTS